MYKYYIMLTSDDSFAAYRLIYHLFNSYCNVYYALNPMIQFPEGLVERSQYQLVMQMQALSVLTFMASNKDVENISELIEKCGIIEIEALRVDTEKRVKQRIHEFLDLSDKEKQLLNRKLYSTKLLARLIGMNLSIVLVKKKEYFINNEASLAKKYVAVNMIIDKLFEKFKDVNVNEINGYVKEHIHEFVHDAETAWDELKFHLP